MLNTFYIYGHFISGETSPFYIGKGTGKRAWSCSGRSDWWKRITNKKTFYVKILFNNLNETMAFFLETQSIKKYGLRTEGTGCLINFTHGGGGTTGYRHTDNTKRKIGDTFRGKQLSKEHIEKLKVAAKLRSITDKQVDRMIQSTKKRRGIPLSDEHRNKIGNSHRGMVRSPVARLNLSIGQGIKPVKLIHTSGVIETVINRSEFCRKYNLHPRCVRHVIQRKVKSHNGWTLFRDQL